MRHSSGFSGSERSRQLLPESPSIRLFVLELSRLMLRKSYSATIILGSVVGVINLYQYRPCAGCVGGDEVRALGAFSYHGDTVFVFLVPLIAGVVGAGSLAADCGLRYCDFLLVRGVSRRRYLLAKSVAMAMAAWIATFVVCGLVSVSAILVFPWGSTTLWRGNPPVEPFPELFVVSPLLSDVLIAVLFSLAAAALALTGLIVGTLLEYEYAAIAFPFVSVIVLAIIPMPSLIALFSPYTYLGPDLSYEFLVPVALQPFGMFLYWIVFGLVCAALGLRLFSGKDLD